MKVKTIDTREEKGIFVTFLDGECQHFLTRREIEEFDWRDREIMRTTHFFTDSNVGLSETAHSVCTAVNRAVRLSRIRRRKQVRNNAPQ